MSAELRVSCKYENVTGICKSKDACRTNLTSVDLEPCNEADLSLVCCPLVEKPPIESTAPPETNITNNRPKRTPGEKAIKSMYNSAYNRL